MPAILVLLAILLAAIPSLARGEQDVPALLLIANDTIDDPNFAHSVVLVIRQPDGGVFGVILNRPTQVALREVFPKAEGLKGRDDPLFFGGPVMPHALAFVFHATEPPPKAVELLPTVFLSADAELLFRLLQRARPTEQLRIFAGCAGWAPGQLENELSRGDWLLLPADADAIFRRNPQRLWRELYERAQLRATRAHLNPEAARKD